MYEIGHSITISGCLQELLACRAVGCWKHVLPHPDGSLDITSPPELKCQDPVSGQALLPYPSLLFAVLVMSYQATASEHRVQAFLSRYLHDSV